MVHKSKLKTALEAEQGVDHELQKQKKLRKIAERRKRKSNPGEDLKLPAEGDASPLDQDAEAETDSEAVASASKASSKPQKPILADSGGLPTPPDEEASAEDEGSDIPFSDLESLASEDREDLIPRQRLTINNHKALGAALQSLKPLPKEPFSEHMSLLSLSETALSVPDADDDLPRELAFYKQSLSASLKARKILRQAKIPFTRPPDYFAEMLKTDEHMGKVKEKLTEEASRKRAAQEARKLRDAKKFGKGVQVAKLQERAREKRDTLEKIKVLKRKRQGGETTNANEEDLFDIALEKETKGEREKGKKGERDGDRNSKRQKKDQKFGFGGKKRYSKSNDAISTSDMSRFSSRKGGSRVQARPKGPVKRLGKSRRAKSSN